MNSIFWQYHHATRKIFIILAKDKIILLKFCIQFMIGFTSKKNLKAYLNCQPIGQSRQQIQYYNQNLSDRKHVTNNQFKNADKGKAKQDEKVKTGKNETEKFVNDNYHEQLTLNKVLTDRKQHSAKNFDKILGLNRFSSHFEKEMFYTPKSHKKLEPQKMVTNSYKYNKKRIETAENQRQTTKRLNGNKMQFYEGSKTDDHDCDVKGRAHWDTTIENKSIDSIKDIVKSNSSSNISSKKQLNTRFGNASRYTLVQDQIASTECLYCRNNKRMVEILAEKNRKLEDQYKAKKGTIKDLYNLCQYFKKENVNLSLQMDKNLQIYRAKQDLFFKEKENFSTKLQNLKAEISQLNQNIKYNVIQNSILIRYKDDYQSLIKQFRKIQSQKQQLKHQSITINQFQSRSLVSKSRQKQRQKLKSNSKQTKDIKMRHKLVGDKAYQYYNKVGYANERKKYVPEDDDISLNLSEQSYSYH